MMDPRCQDTSLGSRGAQHGAKHVPVHVGLRAPGAVVICNALNPDNNTTQTELRSACQPASSTLHSKGSAQDGSGVGPTGDVRLLAFLDTQGRVTAVRAVPRRSRPGATSGHRGCKLT